MTQQHFSTPDPIELYVEIGRGSIHVTAADITDTDIEVTGRDADKVVVEQSGDRIAVVAPRHRTGFLRPDADLDVVARIPQGSDVALRGGSADIEVSGPVGGGHVKSGSGTVSLTSLSQASKIDSGTGDVHVEETHGELRIKSGTGDISIGRSTASVAISTGSGDVALGSSEGDVVIKTGSGDLNVRESHSDLSFATGSGDLSIDTSRRGRVSVNGATTDIRIGIPAGTPVWTDLLTVTGAIHSTLETAGEPEAGADHVELRAKTVSGTITLSQV